jgi:hypothetical protein
MPITVLRNILAFVLIGMLAIGARDITQAQETDARKGALFTKGYETCGAIKGKMEALFPAARSQCQPAPDNDKIGIALASPLPAFRPPETKRAFLGGCPGRC